MKSKITNKTEKLVTVIRTQEGVGKEGKGCSTMFSTQEKPVLGQKLSICLTESESMWVKTHIIVKMSQ